MLARDPIALGISTGVGVQVTDGIVLLNDLIDAIANAVFKERFDIRPRPGYSQPYKSRTGGDAYHQELPSCRGGWC